MWTSSPEAPSPRRQAVAIALLYAVVGATWILVSDSLVAQIASGQDLTRLQHYKGWAFVVATAALVAVAIERALARQATAVKALRESEARFRAYLTHAPSAVFVLDAEGRCLDANPRALDLIGVSLDRLRTMSVWDVAPPGREAVAATSLQSVVEKGWLEGEFALRLPDGTDTWVAVRATQLDDARLLLFAHDIRDRRAADDRLRQAAAVYQSTREGVVITDPQGVIIEVNPAFTQITGYAPEDVVGKTPRVLHSGRQSDEWYEQMWRTLRTHGSWQGEIWNRRKDGEIYPEWLGIRAVRDPDGGVSHYVGVFTDLSRVKWSEAQLDSLAHTDPLTGLPNRLLLSSRLQHAIERAGRTDDQLAVIFVDLDRFKHVNDSFGYEVGDIVLRETARRLQARTMPGDTLARLSADEFVMVCEHVAGAEAAASAAQELAAVVGTPVTLPDGTEMALSASIGISLFPEDGRSTGELLQHAGAAMTYTKRDGGRGFRFHARIMTESARQRLRLEGALRGALDRGEFLLHYQPQLALATRRIRSVEALVRWRHPDGRLVAPDEFIPLAEQMGLMTPLGEWTLATACAQMKVWTHLGTPIESVAVNLSPSQLKDPQLAMRVARVIHDAAIAPATLELELTETALMERGAAAEDVLRALSGLGVHLALDDFGTGYSSLARLRRFPIDTLKIDRAFLKNVPRDPVSCGLVRTIVDLGAQLHLRVVAEGVETEAQLDFLATAACPHAQGFRIGAPMPADDLTPLLTGVNVTR